MATQTKSLQERLSEVQSALVAPKSQYNAFGKYKYRNCEDILEAVKPLLSQAGLSMTITDTILHIGERFYVKATVTVAHGEESIVVESYAREEESKKGMDGSQVTGAASSYARKYALNGMFLIDDTKDSDATNDGGKSTAKPAPQNLPVFNKDSENFEAVKGWIKTVPDFKVGISQLKAKYTVSEETIKELQK